MGLTQSAPKATRKYSDYEIKQNINNLFRTNKSNFSEASYSLNLDNVRTIENNLAYNDQNIQMGGKIKFNPSQKRYLKYDIDEYLKRIQMGGNSNNDAQYVSMSEPEEFNKLRDFLMSGNQQTGGNYELYSTDASINQNNANKFFRALFQMNQYGGDDSMSDEEKDGEEDEDEESDIESESDNDEKEDDEDDEDDEDEEDDEAGEADIDMEAVDKTEETKETKETKENKKNIEETGLSSTSSAAIGPMKSWSSTSYSQSTSNKSSDLNIIPFYSTDSSAQHPYVRNRFH